MTEKINFDELKKSGYIVQGDPEFFVIRLRIPAGLVTSKQLIEIGRIAKKYGNGTLHLTDRQGIQIPYVRYNKLGAITKELKEVGTPPGSCGPRVRNIMACPGYPECSHAIINTYELARKIDERFFDVVLPTKLKIGITGCPNSCAKPQLNDVGIMGVVKPEVIPEKCTACEICVRTCKEGTIRILEEKAVINLNRCVYCGDCIRVCPFDAIEEEKKGYTLFVGGNVGRHPRFADKIVTFGDEETIFNVLENCIKTFEEAVPGERLGHLIDRLGIGEFVKRIL